MFLRHTHVPVISLYSFKQFMLFTVCAGMDEVYPSVPLKGKRRWDDSSLDRSSASLVRTGGIQFSMFSWHSGGDDPFSRTP